MIDVDVAMYTLHSSNWGIRIRSIVCALLSLFF